MGDGGEGIRGLSAPGRDVGTVSLVFLRRAGYGSGGWPPLPAVGEVGTDGMRNMFIGFGGCGGREGTQAPAPTRMGNPKAGSKRLSRCHLASKGLLAVGSQGLNTTFRFSGGNGLPRCTVRPVTSGGPPGHGGGGKHISGPHSSVPGTPPVMATTDVPSHCPLSHQCHVLLSLSILGAPVNAGSVRKVTSTLGGLRGGGKFPGQVLKAACAGWACWGQRERDQTCGMGLAGNRSL